MRIQPLGDRVLILPDLPLTETASGLQLLAQTTPEQTGIVMALGNGHCPRCSVIVDPEFVVGDRVIVPPTAGQELWVGEDRYLVVRTADVLAVMEET